MIYFYCSECKEELEAEDSIRGARMKCPACFKEIEVPQAGVKVTTRVATRRAEREPPAPARAESNLPGARFILVVLVAGLLGALAISGIGWTLHRRAVAEADRRKPRCGACEGKGAVRCAVCSGNRKLACNDCKGATKIKNFKGDEETCLPCVGSGLLSCLVCGGRGEYGCTGCGGTGRLAPGDPPRR